MKLKIGDTIDIIAPASGCDRLFLEQSAEWLNQKGFQIRYSKDILKVNMYLSQKDEVRFRDLKQALTNKTSKAIWCLRGGYGSIRLVSELLKIKKQSPKFFIGMSDITILHQFLIQKWGWSTIHGPMLDQSLRGDRWSHDASETLSLMMNDIDQIAFKNLKPLNPAAKLFIKKRKTLTSKIIGGNLATLCSLIGTELEVKTKNRFLFLEDVGERGYKLDRMLQQMKLAQIFDGCEAVLLGEFIKGDEANGKNYTHATFKSFFYDMKIPVFSGVQSDHSEIQRPLFLNTKAVLKVNSKCNLTVYSPKT